MSKFNIFARLKGRKASKKLQKRFNIAKGEVLRFLDINKTRFSNYAREELSSGEWFVADAFDLFRLDNENRLVFATFDKNTGTDLKIADKVQLNINNDMLELQKIGEDLNTFERGAVLDEIINQAVKKEHITDEDRSKILLLENKAQELLVNEFLGKVQQIEIVDMTTLLDDLKGLRLAELNAKYEPIIKDRSISIEERKELAKAEILQSAKTEEIERVVPVTQESCYIASECQLEQVK